MLDEELEISAPRNRVIKLKTLPGAEPVISDEGDRRVYRWKTSHLARENKDQQKTPRIRRRNREESPRK